MTITNLGRIGFVIQGTFVQGTTYKRLDVVRYGNATYTCNVTTTTQTPGVGTDWQLYALDGGTGVTPIRMNFYGNLFVQTGQVRWYPQNSCSINQVFATLGVSITSSIIAVIRKNETQILTVTIPANTYKSTIQTGLTIPMTTSDYLTVDITQASGGSNLTITIGYT
jgi:hypothetical protein